MLEECRELVLTKAKQIRSTDLDDYQDEYEMAIVAFARPFGAERRARKADWKQKNITHGPHFSPGEGVGEACVKAAARAMVTGWIGRWGK